MPPADDATGKRWRAPLLLPADGSATHILSWLSDDYQLHVYFRADGTVCDGVLSNLQPPESWLRRLRRWLGF